MKTLTSILYHIHSNTFELTHSDSVGNAVSCRNYGCGELDDFKVDAGEHAQKYIDLAGWTPEYIADVRAKAEKKMKDEQDKADAEVAESEAKRKQAEKVAFDAEVARQVAVMEEADRVFKAKKVK